MENYPLAFARTLSRCFNPPISIKGGVKEEILRRKICPFGSPTKGVKNDNENAKGKIASVVSLPRNDPLYTSPSLSAKILIVQRRDAEQRFFSTTRKKAKKSYNTWTRLYQGAVERTCCFSGRVKKFILLWNYTSVPGTGV